MTIKDNERLSASLKMADKLKKQRSPKKHSGQWTSKSASAASRQYWSENPVPLTATMRIQKDAIELAKSAWKSSAVRIAECSKAIRERAMERLRMREISLHKHP